MNNLFITLHGQSWANPWNGDINGSCSLTARKKSSYSGNNLAIFSAKGKNLQITSLQKKVALDLLAMSSCKCVCLYVSAWARLAMPLIKPWEQVIISIPLAFLLSFFLPSDRPALNLDPPQVAFPAACNS